MRSVKRRAAYYVLGVGALILLSSVVYDLAMHAFEPGPYPPSGTEYSIVHSMQVVVETFTATGYGSDSPWRSAEMNLLVMALDITGVALFFLALPAIFLPLFRETLAPSPPTIADSDLADHVVICTYTSRAEALIDELAVHDIEYLLMEPDADRAIELRDAGYSVIHGDPEAIEDLRNANLSTARALVADLADQTDASIVLAARAIDESVRIVSVVDESSAVPYHRLAGADAVVTPRAVLAESLARKITTAVESDLGETVRLGEEVGLVEVPIHVGSSLAGSTLAESGIRDRFGVNVIGAWIRGEFETPVAPDVPLEPGAILLVTGREDQLDRFQSATVTSLRRFRQGETIVIGYGEVGRTVAERVEAADVPVTVVDVRDVDGVDVVGDGTDPEVLEAAGVPSAVSVVIALPDDSAAQFATLVTRELNDEAEVIVRSNQVDGVAKTFRAGANYVLSLATVTGRSMVAHILEGDEILAMGSTVEVVRTRAPALAGRTLEGARVRERTGCTVVAVERGGQLLTEVGPDFELADGDRLILAGPDAGTNRFLELFG